MVSMEMSKKEQKEAMGVMADKPIYPYGMQINLGNEELEKLGMSLPEVGKTFIVTAKVSVSSASSYQREGGEKSDSCSLQITDMEVGPDKKESDAANKLYGKG